MTLKSWSLLFSLRCDMVSISRFPMFSGDTSPRRSGGAGMRLCEKDESLGLLARHLIIGQPVDGEVRQGQNDDPPPEQQPEDGRVQIGPTDV